MAGLEVPAYQLFPRSLPYCDVDLHPLIAYDKEKAVALLEAAGWKLGPGISGGIRQKGGKKLVSWVCEQISVRMQYNHGFLPEGV